MDGLARINIECIESKKQIACGGSSCPSEMTSPALREERAATLVEYSLLLILIMVAAILSLQFFSESVSARFSIISSAVQEI